MANKTHEIHLRLSEDEYNKLKQQQEFLDCPTYASLIRMYIHTGIAYKIDYSGFSDLALEVSRIGNNINQVAMVANSTKSVSSFEIDSLKKELEQIEKLIADNIKTKAKVTKQLGDFFSSDGWIDGLPPKEGDE